MDFEKIRHQREIRAADEAVIAAERSKIFVAGPYVDVTLPRKRKVNSSNLGTILRYGLCTKYMSEGVNVYMGEDDLLRKNGAKNFGKYNNAVIFERHHIVHHIDALIVLPCSPGSFCEIGDWATTKDTSRKSIVIIDKKYERKNNYINDGIVKHAQYNGAVVHYEPYRNIKKIKKICDEFIEDMMASQRIEKLYGR